MFNEFNRFDYIYAHEGALYLENLVFSLLSDFESDEGPEVKVICENAHRDRTLQNPLKKIKRSMHARMRYFKIVINKKKYIYFLQIRHAIYQNIGKWGQEIRFQCQIHDSCTLTDARATSYYREGHFRSILSCDISRHTYWSKEFILRCKVRLDHSDGRTSDQLIPCWSCQINFLMWNIMTYIHWDSSDTIYQLLMSCQIFYDVLIYWFEMSSKV